MDSLNRVKRFIVFYVVFLPNGIFRSQSNMADNTFFKILHYITLHYITFHYTTLHFITLHYIVCRSENEYKHFNILHTAGPVCTNQRELFFRIQIVGRYYHTLRYILLHYITLGYVRYIPSLYVK